MEDNQLYERHNYDDVFNRSVIVGLLHLMNNNIVYEQIWENNIVEKVNVPCMYDFGSSDERFAQDNYTFFGKACFGEKKIDGKFDMLPRAAIKYTGSQIDAANITNRFVKGTYLKDENGKLVSYTSFLYSIPITMSFECEMWIDNIITAFKIEQTIREIFYKNKTFNVLYKGMKIGCTAGFPESSNIEKTVSYTFDSERQIKLTFAFAVECYQPVFDETTAIESSKRIEKIAFDVKLANNTNVNPPKATFKKIDNQILYPSGSNLYIEWTTSSEVSDMCSLRLEYFDENTSESANIENVLYNQGSYVWKVPEDFTGYTQPILTFIETDNIKVVKQPVIKILPDLYNNRKFTERSFIVIDPGEFHVTGLENADYTTIGTTIEYIDRNGNLQILQNYYFYIVNGKIHTSSEHHSVYVDGDYATYNNDINIRKISLKLYYPVSDKLELLDTIPNLLIL